MRLRYALYFTPPADDALTLAAARWLGSNVFTGETSELVRTGAFGPDALKDLTADARRYGFHATLKAPFELADGCREDDLLHALEEFSTTCEPFGIPDIVLGRLGSFFALVPSQMSQVLQSFAGETVRRFEPFRAALSDADIARRHPDALPQRQRDNLMRWGYPYVFEDFRFHMTLTGPVPAEKQAAMRVALEEAFAGFIGRPLPITGIALFIEPQRGAPFIVHTLLPLGGAPKRKIA